LKSGLQEFLDEIRFNDPSQYDFDNDLTIDKNIKETLKNINKSSWCWTLFSCEGHTYEEDKHSLPYFVFIVKKKHRAYLLQLLFDTLDPNISDITDFPLLNTEPLSLSWGYTNDKYAIVNVHYPSTNYLEEEQHNKLMKSFYDMSFKILDAKL
jgi:hypothetical protein